MAARVMVMAGGTGGHVFPALAVAQELRSRGWEVCWMGVPDSFEARTVPQYDFPIEWVDSFRLRGQGLASLLLAPLRLLRAIAQSIRVLRRRKPQVVLGMGGFVTGPGGIASRLLGIPLVIHEQNSIPGLTNQWLARAATVVMQAFPDSFAAKRCAITVGNPVRAEIARIDAPEIRMQGREDVCRVLVLGGSLGAAVLNEVVPQALALLPDAACLEVRHQAGRGKAQETEQAYRLAGVEAHVSDFMHDMAEAYAWADLVICRAGALTITELASAGLAAILVPYPHAVDDHQTRNAQVLVDAGAALLMPQSELKAQVLAEAMAGFCGDRAQLLNMAASARALARPEATAQVADICEEVKAA